MGHEHFVIRHSPYPPSFGHAAYFHLDKRHILRYYKHASCAACIISPNVARVKTQHERAGDNERGDIMKFGEKVRRGRLAAGYSQKRLADMTGIALRTIQNYESCQRLPKQSETYRVLAEALHMDEAGLRDENADFITHVHEVYGSRAAKQAQRLTEEVGSLYAGGELAEEDMDAMMKAIQDAYWIAKKKNRKYVPMKYRKP